MDLPTMIMICSMFHSNATINAMIQNGSEQNPLAITTVAQVGQPGVTKSDFKNIDQAFAYAQAQLMAGKHLNIGVMQIPSGWLTPLLQQGVTLKDLLRPCKNIAVGSDLLNQAETYCATFTSSGPARDQCALSFYETGDPKLGLDYANQMLTYAAANPMDSYNPQNVSVNYSSMMKDSNFALPKPVFSQDTGDLGDVDAK